MERPRDAYRDLNNSYTLDRYGPAAEKCGALDTARWRVFHVGPGGPSCRR